jgi:hypothetical protein
MNKRLLVAILAGALAGCGGGGDSEAEGAGGAGASAPAPAAPALGSTVPIGVTPQAPRSPSGAPPDAPRVATEPAGAPPSSLTQADCPTLLVTVSPPPIVADAPDARLVRDVLAAVDPHGSAEFARVPDEFLWWLRSSPEVDMIGIGTAIHEVNHVFDTALQFHCFADGVARYFADSSVHATDLISGATANYSIVQETYPQTMKGSRALRFDTYISGSAQYPGNDFSILLDELSAYSSGARFEVNLLSSPTYSYLGPTNSTYDGGLGGMADFMLFMQAYLQSARTNHASTYAVIRSQSRTLAFMQFAWTRAEQILADAYPYSASAGGALLVPLDVLDAVYSPAFLAELDALGIAHKTSADMAATYFR